MGLHRRWTQYLTVGMGLVWATSGHALGQTSAVSSQSPVSTPRVPVAPPLSAFEHRTDLPAGVREGLRTVLNKPTLAARGRLEMFRGQPVLYRWFLDHPDQAVLAWRRLGAKCTDITSLGGGCFQWTDGHGSEINWWTVHTGNNDRIWYAEGHARPAPHMPMFPVRALVVLRFADDLDLAGRSIIRDQMDVFVQTDSKTAAVVTKLLGASVPRMAENGVTQMEMFYSALVWFLDHHPDKQESGIRSQGSGIRSQESGVAGP